MYAATSLPRGSVGSAQIANGSIALRDLSPAARRAGTVDPARSKNIVVTKLPGLGSGVYCVQPAPGSGIDPTTVWPVVTPDFLDGTNSQHIAQIVAGPSVAGCGPTVGWAVVTDYFADPGWTRGDIAFSVVVP